MSFGLKNQMNLLEIVRLIAAIKQIEVEVNTCNYDHNLGAPTRPTFTVCNGLKYFSWLIFIFALLSKCSGLNRGTSTFRFLVYVPVLLYVPFGKFPLHIFQMYIPYDCKIFSYYYFKVENSTTHPVFTYHTI